MADITPPCQRISERRMPDSLLARLSAFVVIVCLHLLTSSILSASVLDEMPIERWKDLREAERYQMQIAEKYYREQNWKIAAAEYEKFLTLHEKEHRCFVCADEVVHLPGAAEEAEHRDQRRVPVGH